MKSLCCRKGAALDERLRGSVGVDAAAPARITEGVAVKCAADDFGGGVLADVDDITGPRRTCRAALEHDVRDEARAGRVGELDHAARRPAHILRIDVGHGEVGHQRAGVLEDEELLVLIGCTLARDERSVRALANELDGAGGGEGRVDDERSRADVNGAVIGRPKFLQGVWDCREGRGGGAVARRVVARCGDIDVGTLRA